MAAGEGDVLAVAARQAPYLLEFSLFALGKRVAAAAIPVKLIVGAGEVVIRFHAEQMELGIEFIADCATRVLEIFFHRQGDPAMFDNRHQGLVVRVPVAIQVAARKEQTKALWGAAHAVNLDFGACRFSGGAGEMVGIEYNQSGLVVAIADAGGDDFLSAVSIEVGRGDVLQHTGVPVLGNGFSVGVEEGDLVRIVESMPA